MIGVAVTGAGSIGFTRRILGDILTDPLVGAVCDPPEVWQMVDELPAVQAKWLPRYRRAAAAVRDRATKKPPRRG